MEYGMMTQSSRRADAGETQTETRLLAQFFIAGRLIAYVSISVSHMHMRYGITVISN